MDAQSIVLTFLEVSPGCEEAAPLLDVRLPHFSKLMKRIMKKIGHGQEYYEKTLPRLNHSGELVDSPFQLVLEKEPEHCNKLFARLRGDNGQPEVYELPFIRFSVRKIKESQEDAITPSIPNNDLGHSAMKDALHEFAQKLDHISSSLDALNALKKKPVSRRSTTTRKRTISESTPANTPPVQCASTPAAAAATTGNLLSFATPSGDTSLNPPRVKKPTPEPDLHFQHQLDRTISRVLGRLGREKQVLSYSELEEKLKTQLNDLNEDPNLQDLQTPSNKGEEEEDLAPLQSPFSTESGRKKSKKHKKRQRQESFGDRSQSFAELDSD